MPHRFVLLSLCALALALPVQAQKKNDQLPERTDAEILKTVTLPEGYEATVFARPPQGGYPISVSAAIDGTIFLAVDENGSLGRDRNPVAGVTDPGGTAAAAPSPGSLTPATATASRRVPGKVIRMRDTDGDGHADEFKTFCEVESPRGVIWDGPKGNGPGVLYVMHPPNLTAYYDDNGDGVSDRQEDILTGLGFDLTFRGADHTTNGCRLAIDGFIYIAMGDYGCVNAKAKDGTTLTHRGGGIVRIRPDGTGLELVVEGTRNIYDVAISPTLDIFTRDNTNDGGGWNDRLSFHPPGAHMGYPFLFKNFNEDMIDTLADFGGGSPCGSLWLDEPGLPKGLFTVEWGASGIFYHDDLEPNGAGYKLKSAATNDPKPAWQRSATPQKPWLKLTRPTDMDVDASGRLYITSWEGATFNYNGPYAGYVLRVVKKDAPKVEVPEIAKASAAALFKSVLSPSAVIRLAAQREILRRYDANDFNPDLPDWPDHPNAAVATAYFSTLAQDYRKLEAKPDHPRSQYPEYEKLLNRKGVSLEFILPLTSDNTPSAAVKTESISRHLDDVNPRVRAAAITALRRLHKADAAPAILPLVADPDPIVAHLAFRALRELKAAQVCLGALDSSDDKVKPGALKALYGMYDPAVVGGLIARLGSAPVSGAGRGVSPRQASETTANPTGAAPGKVRDGGTPSPAPETGALPGATAAPFDLRRGILNALCRLANQDAPYESPTVWWSTRPDTSGPVYQPIAWSETDKISAALKTALDASNADDAKWLVQRMYQCKVAYPGLVELMLAKAGNDTPAKLTAIEGLVRNDKSMPTEAISALKAITRNEKELPELRVRALRIFAANAENGAVFPGAVHAFAPLAGHDLPDAKLTAVFEDFTRGAHNAKWVNDYNQLLHGKSINGVVVVAGVTGTSPEEEARIQQRRQLAATVLVNLATGRVGRENERESAKNAVTKSFDKPETAAALLTAIARTGAKPFAEQVKANLNNPNNTVAEAALFAYQKLGLKDAGAHAQLIGAMKYDDIFPIVQKGGDAKEGQQMFLKAACIACHTINADEPPKGPNLSAVAKIYDRAALTESILKPSAKIAQGFESQWFKTKKGEQVEGFVTREGGDSVDVRNIAGQAITIEKGDIVERGKRETSIMPEGLLNAFSPADLQNLLAWLESLKSGK